MRTVGLFLRVEARSARNVSNEVVSAETTTMEEVVVMGRSSVMGVNRQLPRR